MTKRKTEMALTLELFMIAAVCVFIVDVSGWTESWKGALARWTHATSAAGRLRPFDCSLCCTWWGGLLWCIFTGQFSLSAVALCALAAACTKPMLSAWQWIRTLACGLFDMLQRLTDRVLYP